MGCDFEKEEEKNSFSSKIIGPLVKDLTGYETSFRPKVAVFRRKQEFEFQEREQKAKGAKDLSVTGLIGPLVKDMTGYENARLFPNIFISR